ncbi:MAG: hypothetical protein OSJ70_05625 [Bacilli bacterium]|mgnify:CR=1 FL=1|nr:hypothetical protein [Bacilli bacterium]
MKHEFSNSLSSSLNSPYRDFCEEYIRLAELIIQFEQDQMETIDAAEKDEITMLYMGQKTKLSFLGEKGIKNHFKLVKSRVIKESMEKNSGVKQAYNILNRYFISHSVERNKLGMSIKNGQTLMPNEILENYEIAVNQLTNFKIQEDARQKR